MYRIGSGLSSLSLLLDSKGVLVPPREGTLSALTRSDCKYLTPAVMIPSLRRSANGAYQLGRGKSYIALPNMQCLCDNSALSAGRFTSRLLGVQLRTASSYICPAPGGQTECTNRTDGKLDWLSPKCRFSTSRAPLRRSTPFKDDVIEGRRHQPSTPPVRKVMELG